MGILIPLVLIFFTCLIIWRACDGFELASEYIGRNLSEGVRGGTINAISSSIPELFTTLIALFVLSDREGFSVGIGTTAGSALFNGMIIPAACILSVVGFVIAGKQVDSVNVSTKVLRRDGITLILCEIVLIVLINGDALHWWQGFVLMMLYGVYMVVMWTTMKRTPNLSLAANADDETIPEQEDASHPPGFVGRLFYWLSGGPVLDLERWMVRDHHRQQIKNETWNGWGLLLVSTTVIGAACYLLVFACEWLGSGPANVAHPSYVIFGWQLEGLGMPAMFVAVIFASMATSVPDTVISIRDARDGDYDDAVANALGSNIFDIGFALGFPLFMFTLIHGPIEMAPEVAAQSGELRLLLLGLTVVGFLIYYLGRRGVMPDGSAYVEMRKHKAALLLLIYLTFVVYIVGRSQDSDLAEQVSQVLRSILDQLPKLG
ncbi:MAG: sodium:calcium antiporter [Planctomycetota bacterium]